MPGDGTRPASRCSAGERSSGRAGAICAGVVEGALLQQVVIPAFQQWAVRSVVQSLGLGSRLARTCGTGGNPLGTVGVVRVGGSTGEGPVGTATPGVLGKPGGLTAGDTGLVPGSVVVPGTGGAAGLTGAAGATNGEGATGCAGAVGVPGTTVLGDVGACCA